MNANRHNLSKDRLARLYLRIVKLAIATDRQNTFRRCQCRLSAIRFALTA